MELFNPFSRKDKNPKETETAPEVGWQLLNDDLREKILESSRSGKSRVYTPNDSRNSGSELAYKSTLQAPRGGRSLEDYEEDLGFKKEDLNGKVVLDLGSGESERLSREVQESGIDAKVVSLNPDYVDPSYERYREALTREFPDREKLSVAAIGQKLPFKDASFDEILALWSIGTYLKNDFGQALSESYRILKPGGVARIGPLFSVDLLEDYESKWRAAAPEADLSIEVSSGQNKLSGEKAFILRLTLRK